MSYFTPKTFAFLKDLETHNDRDWFKANQDAFEAHVREPALRFITDAGHWFEAQGLPYRAEAKKVGGSLSRIHRDTRFSDDKTPFHTHVILHFRHKDETPEHPMPVLGIKFDTKDIGLGGGIWMAQTPVLNQIRDAIIQDGKAWDKAKAGLVLGGESLKTAPKGFDKDDPRIQDLRRKAYFAHIDWKRTDLTGDLQRSFQQGVKKVRPFLTFLEKALA